MGKGAICPLPRVFKRLVLQTHKDQGLFGKGLTTLRQEGHDGPGSLT